MLNILDQPWTLLMMAVAAFIILSIVGKFAALKPRFLPIITAVFIAAAGFGLDFLVETDLEKIKNVITTGVNAAKEENADAIEPLISDDYSDSIHRNKERFMRFCKRRFSKPLIDKAIKTVVSVDITGSEAEAVFTIRLVFDKKSQAAEFIPLMLMKIKLDLRKAPPSHWLITKAKVLEINGQSADWKNINY